jgi:hypothetical protein
VVGATVSGGVAAGAPRLRKRIAVMQPYFFPYAGYFRLFARADEFVLYDCVQFPRRGRVHRCEVPAPGPDPAMTAAAVAAVPETQWLTLPLARQPRETTIAGLRFADDARPRFAAALRAQPWLAAARGPAADAVRAHLHAPLDDVVDYLEAGLALVCGLLGVTRPIVRSSTLGIDPALRGQARILAIAAARGADAYVNAPGGRALYDAGAFAAAGVSLEFLPDYAGPFRYLLPALVSDAPERLAADVRAA